MLLMVRALRGLSFGSETWKQTPENNRGIPRVGGTEPGLCDKEKIWQVLAVEHWLPSKPASPVLIEPEGDLGLRLHFLEM